MRQSGSLSPVLSVYVDNVIDVHLKSNLGCYIGHRFMGIIMYADYLVRSANFKNEFCQLDLRIIANKSNCLWLDQRVFELISINEV